MRLVITDVTEMHQGNYCVAGWHVGSGRMVRPLPNGLNWTASLLAQHGIVPGATVDVDANGVQPNSAYPHRTEDTPIVSATITLVSPGPVNWFGPGTPPTATTLDNAFQTNVSHNSVWNGQRRGVYVPAGIQCRSLWALLLTRQAVVFVEDFGKLKAVLSDGVANFKLAVSSRMLKEAWRIGGLQAINQMIPATANLHVRVGLARAFGNPADKCYAMVNGVYW